VKKLALLLMLAILGSCAIAEVSPAMPAGYVRVSTATRSGWLPLPVEEDTTFPLVQIKMDGTQSLNLIHLMPDGVYMEDATCENHDCMGQGEVTLENIPERVLGNMIICLPNQVVLELFTAEETLAILGELPVLPEATPQPDTLETAHPGL